MKVTIESIYESKQQLDKIVQQINFALGQIGYENIKDRRDLQNAITLTFKDKNKYYRLWLSKSGHVEVLNNPPDKSYPDEHMPEDERFVRWLSEWTQYTT